jgi:hypothetical protein
MKALGIATGYPSGNHGRPVVTCVLLEGSRTSPVVLDAFDFKTPADDAMDQLQDLARALASKLSGLEVDAAIIRVADRAPMANQNLTPRRRMLIEGALALCCREKTSRVGARNGKELGDDTGLTKAGVLARGRTIDARRPDAAAAALSVLPEQVTS